MISIQFLGDATLRRDGALVTGPPAQRHRLALLALLAGAHPGALSRDRAMALLWPDAEPERARRLLNLAVHVLRRVLGDAAIITAGDRLLLDAAHVACDVVRFRAACAADDPAGAPACYGGCFLDGFHLPDSVDFDYWLEAERSALASAHAAALLRLAHAHLAAGDATAAAAVARELAAADPFSGPHARTLMLALEAAGDRAGALRHGQEHVRRLRAELGIDADAETVATLQRLLTEDTPPPRAGPAADKAIVLPMVAVVSPQSPGGRDRPVEREVRELLTERLLRAGTVRIAADGTLRARAAAADIVLDADIERTAERVLLRLRMVNAADGEFMLVQRFEAPTGELALLAERSAEAVLAALRATPVHASPPPRSDDLEEAEMLCVRGRHFCARREESSLQRALECFQRARQLAPGHAPAHTGIAKVYAILGFYDLLPPREAFALAKQAALTAHALNPADPECHASLGYIAKYYDWHWRTAERELDNALAIDPASALAHQWFGNYFVLRGLPEDAVAAMKRAVRLAPDSAIAAAATGWAHYFAGRHDVAITYCLEAAELDPQLPQAHSWMAFPLQAQGRHLEAVEACRTAVRLSPTSAGAEAGLGHALATAGDRDGAREILRRLRQRRHTAYTPPYELGKLHLALGEQAQALTQLEAAYRDRSHSMGLLAVDPQLAALHDQPRFRALVDAVGSV